jgi:hypothetical protein
LARRSLISGVNSVATSEFLPEIFKQEVTDYGSDESDSKVTRGKNVGNCPGKAVFAAHPRALKFAHEEIGVKQKDNECGLNQRFPEILFHRDLRLWIFCAKNLFS